MKYFIALIFTFFSIYTVSAQDSQRCIEIVNIAVDAVNNHSVENLHEHLAPDFVCAGQSGPIAIQVLAQIITQMVHPTFRVIRQSCSAKSLSSKYRSSLNP